MTNKQIINGVDVSGCQYNGGDLCSMSRGIYCFCTNKPNCIYKRLKRKEQECEELKQTLIEIKELAESKVKPNLVKRMNGTASYGINRIIELAEVKDDRQS